MNLVLSAVVAASAILAASQAKQVPWPNADAVAKARRDVAELYGDRLAKAKKPCDKVALGRELLKVAEETVDDPAAQFTLYYEARDLGVEAKDWALTTEAIDAVVDRFKIEKPMEPAEQIRHGDALCDEARKKLPAERLAMRLEAAEWYTRAKRSKGLRSQIAEKRLIEVANAIGCRITANDLKFLIGTWEVTATNGYHARWTFFPDGMVHSTNGADKGTWIVEPTAVKISWNEKAWETFYRPLNISSTSGDSWQGAGIIRAKKIAD